MRKSLIWPLALGLLCSALAGCSGSKPLPASPTPAALASPGTGDPYVSSMNSVIDGKEAYISGPQAEALGGVGAVLDGQRGMALLLLREGVGEKILRASDPRDASLDAVLPFLSSEGAAKFKQQRGLAASGDKAAVAAVRALAPYGQIGRGQALAVHPFKEYSIGSPRVSAATGGQSVEMLYTANVKQTPDLGGSPFTLVRDLRVRLTPYPQGRSVGGVTLHWLISDWSGDFTTTRGR